MGARACIVRHRHYPGDPRTKVQVQALQESAYEVDFVGTRRSGEPYFNIENGVRVFRLPALERKRAGKLHYLAEYVTFIITSLLALAILQVRRKYKLVQICNLPDFLVFAALIPKLLGAKIILDLRESTPEFNHTLNGTKMDSVLMKLLIAAEQKSIAFADVVLTCTEQMRQAFIRRGANPEKVFVMLNSVDPNRFCCPVLPYPTTQAERPFRIVTHGTITKRYGHDVLIRAMPLVLKEVPQAVLEIMGRGNWKEELEHLVETYGLSQAVTFMGYLPFDDLISRLRTADCGIVSMPKNIETDLIHTNKMHEYMALGVPVIISRTKAVEAYYDDTCLCFFEAGNEQDLAQAIINLYQNPDTRYQLAKNALKAYEKNSAPKQKHYYSELVLTLSGYKLLNTN